jgi:hypothetical protein
LEQNTEENIWTWGVGGGRGQKLHDEELHNLYSFPNFVSIIKTKADEMSSAYTILDEKSQWKMLLGRSRHRWEDNIKYYKL